MVTESQKYDKTNMGKIILDFPKQFQVGIAKAKNVKIKKKFKGVVVCGMGGSSLPGDLLDTWIRYHKIELPLIINRSYELPIIKTNYLYVCISYSGNTEELLYNYQETLKHRLSVVAITSGGKLAHLADKNKTPLITVPKGVPPRLALGYQSAALMRVLTSSGIIKDSLQEILQLEKSLYPQRLKPQGEKLARELKRKIPIIYAPDLWKNLARIWKINFCENAKILAFHNYFTELCHNEIVGFDQIKKKQLPPSKLYGIFLKDRSSHPHLLKQMDIAKRIITKEGIKVKIIEIKGKNFFEKIFSSLLLSFWTSYHLALLYKTDPTPVKTTEEIKRELSKIKNFNP